MKAFYAITLLALVLLHSTVAQQQFGPAPEAEVVVPLTTTNQVTNAANTVASGVNTATQATAGVVNTVVEAGSTAVNAVGGAVNDVSDLVRGLGVIFNGRKLLRVAAAPAPEQEEIYSRPAKGVPTNMTLEQRVRRAVNADRAAGTTGNNLDVIVRTASNVGETVDNAATNVKDRVTG